jgi:mannan endo-1,4-beta-mannosidase
MGPCRTGNTARSKNDFFSNRECKRMYKENIRKVIQRVNVFTGVMYRDDPTIMAWELINEPRQGGARGPHVDP